MNLWNSFVLGLGFHFGSVVAEIILWAIMLIIIFAVLCVSMWMSDRKRAKSRREAREMWERKMSSTSKKDFTDWPGP